jgi:nicotinate-nucleotide pyrophosphorylase (carboxylating)
MFELDAVSNELIRLAAEEDLGQVGDRTSSLLPDPRRPVSAAVVARGRGVLCGIPMGDHVVHHFSARLGQPLTWTTLTNPITSRPWQDGDALERGDRPTELSGPLAAVLAAERTLLNFLTRLSGVATLTRRYVEEARAGNEGVQVCDTRKTIPGWRTLDKYAVRCGGGMNHRLGLHDAVLIKDNHIAGVPIDRLDAYLVSLLEKLRGNPAGGSPRFVEVEIDSILLDNFAPHQIREAVRMRSEGIWPHKPRFEASGGVTLENIAQIASTGVDRISVGAITHSAPALDLALDVVA